MERLTNRDKEIPLPNADNALFWARVHEKLARYEDAEERCNPCKPTQPECGECEYAKPITNADRLRSMTDEELAEVIKNPCDMGLHMSNEWCKKRNCGYQCSFDWLKRETEGEEH